MKAALRVQYGPPSALHIGEVSKPTPQPREILVKVYATTVNHTDCAVLTGWPLAIRLFTGLFKPKMPITGTDFAGQVEAIGQEVKSFEIGDQAYPLEKITEAFEYVGSGQKIGNVIIDLRPH